MNKILATGRDENDGSDNDMYTIFLSSFWIYHSWILNFARERWNRSIISLRYLLWTRCNFLKQRYVYAVDYVSVNDTCDAVLRFRIWFLQNFVNSIRKISSAWSEFTLAERPFYALYKLKYRRYFESNACR